MTSDWRDLFPLDSEPRDEQRRAIDVALGAFESGVDTVVLDLPTGIGKSAVAVTVARYLAERGAYSEEHDVGAYVLTTQKLLQQQYLRDFANERRGGALELKSATNYECGYDAAHSCGESKRALKALGKAVEGTRWKRYCTESCVYSAAKKRFLQGRLGVTNYSYFLAETTYSGKLVPRQLLVLDECHNIEQELCKFIEIEITDRFCKKHLDLTLPKHDDPDKLYRWMTEKYKPSVQRKIETIRKALANTVGVSESSQLDGAVIALARENDLLDKHLCKVNRFLNRFDPAAWVVDRESRADHRGDRAALRFKPIDAVAWAEPSLLRFGQRRLLMSATVLDKDAFCRSLGLDPERVRYASAPSPFPKENRPIHYMPVGKMSRDDIDATLPRMAEAVRQLLEAHTSDKGIIHACSFKVTNYIRDALRDPRLLTHGDVEGDRDAVLEKHRLDPGPTVLLSPSMLEGVSLDDGLSRFQIFVKVPYPNLNDKTLRKRIQRDPWYYDFLTTKSFVQGLGRSVRHAEDMATTYVLDSCFAWFLKKNEGSIPQYVKEAIVK